MLMGLMVVYILSQISLQSAAHFQMSHWLHRSLAYSIFLSGVWRNLVAGKSIWGLVMVAGGRPLKRRMRNLMIPQFQSGIQQ
jgi:hypothetical protein